MVKLLLHGTSIFSGIKVDKKLIKLDKSGTWKSPLAIGHAPEIVANVAEAGDYLLVELSYILSCPLAIINGIPYSDNMAFRNTDFYKANEANITERLDAKKCDFEQLQPYFDSYIELLRKHFDSEHIILARLFCPDKYVKHNHVRNYRYPQREEFNEIIKKYEDYFIEKLNPYVIDVAKYYYIDMDNMTLGPAISYESGFAKEIELLAEKIVLKKLQVKHTDKTQYHFILEKYVRYYEHMKVTDKLHTLVDKIHPVDRLVRALSLPMVERYKYALESIYNGGYENLEEAIGENGYEFQFSPRLRDAIRLIIAIDNGDFTNEEIDYDWIFRDNFEVQAELLMTVRDYYAENQLMSPTLIYKFNLKEFFKAMQAHIKGDYACAAAYINDAVEKLPFGVKKLKLRGDAKEQFINVIGYYCKYAYPAFIDVAGSNPSFWSVNSRDDKYKVSIRYRVNPFSTTFQGWDEMSKLARNSRAGWIVVDIQGLMTESPIEESELQNRVDEYCEWLRKEYGDKIILNYIDVKHEYREVNGDMKEIYVPNTAQYISVNKIVHKWQEYMAEKLGCHVINYADKYDADDMNMWGPGPVNYSMKYYEEVGAEIDRIVSADMQREYKITTLVNAYCNNNLGDDLFLEILCKRYPNQKFYVETKMPHATKAIEKMANAEIININEKPVYKKYKNFIVIGGSMFMQNSMWIEKLWNLKNLQKKASKSYLLGANFGPYTDEEYRQRHNDLFGKYTDVCFREEYSYDLFKDNKKVRKASDIVFSYHPKTTAIEQEKAIISVINLKNRQELMEYSDEYIRIIADLCKDMTAIGIDVTLMSFCDNEGDAIAIKDIMASMDVTTASKVSQFSYDGDIDKAMEELASAKYIVGTRFHSIILGLLLNKVVYPIVYSNKTKNMLQDIKFTGKYMDLRNPEAISAEDVQSNKTCKVRCEKLASKAEEQFRELDKLFRRS